MLCCFTLFVCLFDLACFFLSSLLKTLMYPSCMCNDTKIIARENLYTGVQRSYLAYVHFAQVQRSSVAIIASMQSGAEPVDCIYTLIVSDDL